MAFDAAVPNPADDPNPSMLMISEVHTSDITGADFFEIYTKLKGQPVSLENYYVIVAERGGSRQDSLQVTQVMDLGKKTLPAHTQYGVITTAEGGITSLVAPFPSADWRTFVPTNLENWLDVKDKKFLSIFLVYSKTKIIPDVLPAGKKLHIKDQLLEDLKKYAVDYITIKKHNGPSTCKLVDSIVQKRRLSKRMDILDLFLEEHTRSNLYSLSISRCASDLPFDMRSFKHSLQTPHIGNDCSGRLFKVLIKNIHSHN